MPWSNGIYVSAGGSPLERLYGTHQKLDEMRKLKEQQALEEQRKKILAESYTPEQAARTEYAVASNPMESLFGVQPQQFAGNSVTGYRPAQNSVEQRTPAQARGGMIPELGAATQIPAKEAAFDLQGAINRLYSIGDLEGAEKLENNQYKSALSGRASAGGTEKWSKTGRIVRGADGKLYSQVQSDYGNSKLVPVDGELVGQNQIIKAGGKTYVKDAYTGETREVIESTLTPGEALDNDTEHQANLAQSKAKGKERGEADAKADLGAEKGIPTVEKTLGIVAELRNHPGREWGTGGSSWASAIPGTAAFDFKVKLEQLTGQTFLNEVEKMRGLGTLTETEGKKLSVAAAALNAAQSEPEFLRQLELFEGELNAARTRHQQRLSGGSPRPANIPAAAIEMLRKNPSLAKKFDEKYGSGAASRALRK